MPMLLFLLCIHHFAFALVTTGDDYSYEIDEFVPLLPLSVTNTSTELFKRLVTRKWTERGDPTCRRGRLDPINGTCCGALCGSCTSSVIDPTCRAVIGRFCCTDTIHKMFSHRNCSSFGPPCVNANGPYWSHRYRMTFTSPCTVTQCNTKVLQRSRRGSQNNKAQSEGICLFLVTDDDNSHSSQVSLQWASQHNLSTTIVRARSKTTRAYGYSKLLLALAYAAAAKNDSSQSKIDAFRLCRRGIVIADANRLVLRSTATSFLPFIRVFDTLRKKGKQVALLRGEELGAVATTTGTAAACLQVSSDLLFLTHRHNNRRIRGQQRRQQRTYHDYSSSSNDEFSLENFFGLWLSLSSDERSGSLSARLAKQVGGEDALLRVFPFLSHPFVVKNVEFVNRCSLVVSKCSLSGSTEAIACPAKHLGASLHNVTMSSTTLVSTTLLLSNDDEHISKIVKSLLRKRIHQEKHEAHEELQRALWLEKQQQQQERLEQVTSSAPKKSSPSSSTAVSSLASVKVGFKSNFFIHDDNMLKESKVETDEVRVIESEARNLFASLPPLKENADGGGSGGGDVIKSSPSSPALSVLAASNSSEAYVVVFPVDRTTSYAVRKTQEMRLRMLLFSIARTKDSRPIVVLCDDKIPLLDYENIMGDYIHIVRVGSLHPHRRRRPSLLALHAWRLTQFRRIVLLSSSLLVLGKLGNLFLAGDNKLDDYILAPEALDGDGGGFSSQLLSLKPSLARFESMRKSLIEEEQRFPLYDVGFNDFMHKYIGVGGGKACAMASIVDSRSGAPFHSLPHSLSDFSIGGASFINEVKDEEYSFAVDGSTHSRRRPLCFCVPAFYRFDVRSSFTDKLGKDKFIVAIDVLCSIKQLKVLASVSDQDEDKSLEPLPPLSHRTPFGAIWWHMLGAMCAHGGGSCEVSLFNSTISGQKQTSWFNEAANANPRLVDCFEV